MWKKVTEKEESTGKYKIATINLFGTRSGVFFMRSQVRDVLAESAEVGELFRIMRVEELRIIIVYSRS